MAMPRGRERDHVEILKRISVRLYWCPRCNVPVLGRACGACGGSTVPVRITPPGDIRPALGADLEGVHDLFREYLGDGWSEVVPRRRVVLLNKIQYPDMADEVIFDGVVVAHRFYDVECGKWRIKPMYGLVHAMLNRRIGAYAVVGLPRLARGYEVHRSKIVEAGADVGSRGVFVALSTKGRGFHGVGQVVGGGRIRVLKCWRRRPFSWHSADPSWEAAVRANIGRLRRFEEEAVRFIREVVDRYKLPAFVSFSGGKDSLVTYALARRALGKVAVLFNDTGVELPETVEYVRRFAEREGADLITACAGDAFWRGARIMGPPARDFRWCCKVIKLAPISRAVKERFPGGAVSLVGQRKFESASRALSARVWRNRWLPSVIAAAPILAWTGLDVWLYIMWRGLRANPLYYRGFDRLGCWLCPSSELGEMERVAEVHPDLWKKWRDMLLEFAGRSGLTEEWVRLGAWRWLRVPGDFRRILERRGLRTGEEARGAPIGMDRRGETLILEVGGSSSESRLAELLGTLGDLEVDGDLHVLRLRGAVINVRALGGRVLISSRGAGEHDVEEVVKAVIRSCYCVGCGLCASWCPTQAIRLKDGLARVDRSRCRRCGLCNGECPIAEYTLLARRATARPRPARPGR